MQKILDARLALATSSLKILRALIAITPKAQRDDLQQALKSLQYHMELLKNEKHSPPIPLPSVQQPTEQPPSLEKPLQTQDQHDLSPEQPFVEQKQLTLPETIDELITKLHSNNRQTIAEGVAKISIIRSMVRKTETGIDWDLVVRLSDILKIDQLKDFGLPIIRLFASVCEKADDINKQCPITLEQGIKIGKVLEDVSRGEGIGSNSRLHDDRAINSGIMTKFRHMARHPHSPQAIPEELGQKSTSAPQTIESTNEPAPAEPAQVAAATVKTEPQTPPQAIIAAAGKEATTTAPRSKTTPIDRDQPLSAIIDTLVTLLTSEDNPRSIAQGIASLDNIKKIVRRRDITWASVVTLSQLLKSSILDARGPDILALFAAACSRANACKTTPLTPEQGAQIGDALLEVRLHRGIGINPKVYGAEVLNSALLRKLREMAPSRTHGKPKPPAVPHASMPMGSHTETQPPASTNGENGTHADNSPYRVGMQPPIKHVAILTDRPPAHEKVPPLSPTERPFKKLSEEQRKFETLCENILDQLTSRAGKIFDREIESLTTALGKIEISLQESVPQIKPSHTAFSRLFQAVLKVPNAKAQTLLLETLKLMHKIAKNQSIEEANHLLGGERYQEFMHGVLAKITADDNQDKKLRSLADDCQTAWVIVTKETEAAIETAPVMPDPHKRGPGHQRKQQNG